MPTLKVNAAVLEEFIRRYRPDAVKREGGSGTAELVFRCPFHNDSHASFHLNLTKGVGYCFSCPDNKGYTIEALLEKLENITRKEAHALAKKSGILEKSEETDKERERRIKEERGGCGIKEDTVTEWQTALLSNPRLVEDLVKNTGWTAETLQRWKIGWDGTRYTFPLYSGTQLATVKFYAPNGSPKYSGVKGYNASILWPQDVLRRNRIIYLVEGEKDCITAHQYGIPAVTFTGGAGTVPKDWIALFKDKTVYIIYDFDEAGRTGAIKAAESLSRVANEVRILNIATIAQENEIPISPGGDVTDILTFCRNPRVITDSLSLFQQYTLREQSGHTAIGSDVISTYLEDIQKNKLFYKRVYFKARVISVHSEKTYLVPRRVDVSCDRNWGEHCSFCPLMHEDGVIKMAFKAEHPEVLKMIEGTDKQIREALTSVINIPPKCPKFIYKIDDYQTMFPIVLIPAIEKDKPNHSYTMQIAWAMNSEAKPNEDYQVRATVVSNPDTQEMVLLCHSMSKDTTSIDEFELSDEMKKALRIFQCQTDESRSAVSSSSSDESTPTLPQTSPESTGVTTST